MSDSEKNYLIEGFGGDTELIERLQELGFREGQFIELCGQAPFLGPLLFRIGSTTIALREDEAQCLQLKKI